MNAPFPGELSISLNYLSGKGTFFAPLGLKDLFWVSIIVLYSGGAPCCVSRNVESRFNIYAFVSPPTASSLVLLLPAPLFNDSSSVLSVESCLSFLSSCSSILVFISSGLSSTYMIKASSSLFFAYDYSIILIFLCSLWFSDLFSVISFLCFSAFLLLISCSLFDLLWIYSNVLSNFYSRDLLSIILFSSSSSSLLIRFFLSF